MSSLPIIYDHKAISPVTSPIAMAITTFMLSVKRDLSPTTYKTYSSKMKLFRSYLSTYKGVEHHRELLKGFKSFLQEHYSSASSINLTFSVVRSFYKYLLEQGVLERDFSVVLKNVKESKEVKRSHLTRSQINKIIDHLNNMQSKNAKRNRTMFILLLMNGLRVSELANIEIQDIKQHGGRIVLFLKRKGYLDKSNFVVLKEETYQMLLEFIGDRTEGALFRSSRSNTFMSGGEISRIIKTIFKRCGIDDKAIVAHSLRTTFAVLCVESNVPLVNISKAMNHASTSTTDRYLKSYNRLSQPAEDAINIGF